MQNTDDDLAFEAFVSESFARLCRAGYLFCGDWHKSEDAVVTSLLRLHRRWRRVSDPEAYVRRALVTILIDESRRPWRREHPESDLHDADDKDHMSRIDDRDEMTRALDRLPPRQRACVVLRYYQDASVAQTAAALECSEGNVKRLTSDALQSLRALLDDSASHPPDPPARRSAAPRHMAHDSADALATHR